MYNDNCINDLSTHVL